MWGREGEEAEDGMRLKGGLESKAMLYLGFEEKKENTTQLTVHEHLLCVENTTVLTAFSLLPRVNCVCLNATSVVLSHNLHVELERSQCCLLVSLF